MKAWIKNEKGNALILMAIGLGMATAMCGVVIDGGHLYKTQSSLQKTVNATALSGAQELMNSEEEVSNVVDEVLEAHGESESLFNMDVLEEQSVRVELERPTDVFFSSLFGVETVDINAAANVEVAAVGEASGAAPFGINEETDLVFNETYDLKVDSGDSTGGNFGILALEGPGAKTYEETLKSGYDEPLRVGEVVNTQTGNISGPTERGVNHRIDNCPSGDMYNRDCDRVMLIPVYAPIGDSDNFREVEIRGFAYFYLEERMDKNDDSVQGRFIKRVGGGTIVEGSASRGAYTTRLTQ